MHIESRIRYVYFLKNNQILYRIEHHGNTSIISLAYHAFSSQTMQQFINIVEYEQQKQRKLGPHSYQMKNSTTQHIDFEMRYDNQWNKNEDNAFSITFFNNTL